MNCDLQTQALHSAADLLRGLVEVAVNAPAHDDRRKLFAAVLSEARRLTRAEAGNLYVLRRDRLQRVAWQNDRQGFADFCLPEPDQDRLNSTQSVPGYVAATGETVSLADVASPPAGAPYAADRDASDAYPVRSLLAAPLATAADRCIGVLELLNHLGSDGSPSAFSAAEACGLPTLAAMAAVTVENALRLDDMKASHLDTIIRLSAVAERRDNASIDHVRRVSLTAGLIARAMGLDEHEAELIEFASPMHDIGKVGVAEAVLHKTEPLTPEERRQVEEHAALGDAILGAPGTDLIEMARLIATTHHERWDGMGYPESLDGKDIPAGGRIVALADTFDVLLSDRCYKEAYGLAKVLITIRSERGKQFDPDVVDAFFAVLAQVLEIYGLSDPVAAMSSTT